MLSPKQFATLTVRTNLLCKFIFGYHSKSIFWNSRISELEFDDDRAVPLISRHTNPNCLTGTKLFNRSPVFGDAV